MYAAARPVQRKRQRVVAHDGTVEPSPSATNADEYRTGIVVIQIAKDGQMYQTSPAGQKFTYRAAGKR